MDFKKKKVLIVHPGTQYSPSLAAELSKRGLLLQFRTGFVIIEGGLRHKLLKMLPAKFDKYWQARILYGVPRKLVNSNALLELITLFFLKVLYKKTEFILFLRNKFFQLLTPDSVIKESDIVIGFDTSSWILIEKARKYSKIFILDVSIGHSLEKQKIFSKITNSYHDWSIELKQKDVNILNKELIEFATADKIVVPSEFVKETLLKNGVSEELIFVNPFGTNLSYFRRLNSVRGKRKRTFLFMGSISARKGIPVLLDSWRESGEEGELLIAGYGPIPESVKLPPNVKLLGKTATNKRLELFNSADVFVFPSFFEGLAQVQIEAMACGLVLIGTKESGASELIDEGENGFIIEAGNTFMLTEKIRYLVNIDELELADMKCRSLKKAEGFSWSDYGDRWGQLISEIS